MINTRGKFKSYNIVKDSGYSSIKIIVREDKCEESKIAIYLKGVKKLIRTLFIY